MKNTKRVIAGFVTTGMLVASLSGCSGATLPEELAEEDIQTGFVTTGVSIHDPMVIQDTNGRFYMFGSHMTAAYADDLSSWTSISSENVSASNALFDNLLEEPFAAFDFVGKNSDNWYSVWAPSVIYNETMGKYVMYFCTTSSYIMSNICYATADSIDGPYTYQDTILYSGFTKANVEDTDFYEVMGEDVDIKNYVLAGYNNSLWPNCIDPALFYDEDGRLWMTYGSWSGGIFLLEIDQETGDVIHPEADAENYVDTYFGKRLVGGGHHAIEGPYIQYDEDSGYYYLFLSYGNLQREGGYQIRVFRSEEPDGEYVDAAGQTFGITDDLDTFADYGTKLMGNYTLPSLNMNYMAPGGQSTFTSDGKLYIVYHQRFDNGTEYHEPRIHQMAINAEGWPVIFPFQTNGETLSEEGYRTSDIEGTFYLLNHELDISSDVHEAEKTTFSNGEISGAYSGTYEVEKGTNYITVTIDGVTYSGVLIQMTDEAGNNTLCFSAVGDNNESLWGVHYMQSEES